MTPLVERELSLPNWDGSKGVRDGDDDSEGDGDGDGDNGDIQSKESPLEYSLAGSGSIISEELRGVGGGNATLFSCTINLANTIVGAGMLGLPGAFGGTGYVGGPVLIFVGAAFSAHGLVLLAKAAIMVGNYPSSFYTVARAAVPRYTVLIDLAVALKCFGVATGYLITVADCMIEALDHILVPGGGPPETMIVSILLSRRFWVATAAFGVLPVSFFREFDKLKHASAAALAFVFLLALGIVAYARGLADPCEGYGEDTICVGEKVPFTDGPTTASKLPIFIFAFTCQQNIFPIVNEIQRRSMPRISMVVVAAIGFALVLFLVVAIEGYLTYGNNVKGDILLNYPETGKVTFMRVCIAFMLILHYPLQLDPSRRCIMSLIKVVRKQIRSEQRRRHYRRNDSAESPEMVGILNGMDVPSQHLCTEISSFKASPPPRDYKGVGERRTEKVRLAIPKTGSSSATSDDQDILFLAVTISFLLCSFGIALTVKDLGVILAIVGATGSTLVSYVLPGLVFVNVQRRMSAAKMAAYVQLAAGCLIMPTSLYFLFQGGASE